LVNFHVTILALLLITLNTIVRSEAVFAILYVRHAFAEFALCDIGCGSSATRELLDIGKFEADDLIMDFFAMVTFCLKPPVRVRTQNQVFDVLKTGTHAQINSHL
jgi:hypothetical protein